MGYQHPMPTKECPIPKQVARFPCDGPGWLLGAIRPRPAILSRPIRESQVGIPGLQWVAPTGPTCARVGGTLWRIGGSGSIVPATAPGGAVR
jgi:hypothetical protein